LLSAFALDQCRDLNVPLIYETKREEENAKDSAGNECTYEYACYGHQTSPTAVLHMPSGPI